MGIHSNPGFAKGKRAPSKRDSVKFGDFLITLPTLPLVDLPPTYNYPMDGNDVVGDCVVAGWDHSLQVILGLLFGIQKNFTQDQIWAFYKTQNPNFDPNGTASTNGPGSSSDNGMDIQVFLEYLVAQKYILGFASINWKNEAQLKAAIYLGLSVMTGVQLQQAQMSQFDIGVWDFVPGSPVDGGHCIPLVGFLGSPDNLSLISWGKLLLGTMPFILNQMDECWFILTQAHIDHPSFRNHFDLAGFAQAVNAITNGKVVIAVNPTLRIGSTGPSVVTLQDKLNAAL